MSHAINHPLQPVIENLWENRNDLSPTGSPKEAVEAIDQVIHELDRGALRVAEKINGQWVVNQWLKKAVLLSFRINENRVMDGGANRYYDKIETKFATYTPEDFAKAGVRVVPNANARHGSYIAP
ncbi:MAG: 2,3,4,5-tetrahydropyridine-2,6-dicarboxylate N-succinyltransferase, partial [Fluviibacter sp.]